jgi:hypothetical protein
MEQADVGDGGCQRFDISGVYAAALADLDGFVGEG